MPDDKVYYVELGYDHPYKEIKWLTNTVGNPGNGWGIVLAKNMKFMIWFEQESHYTFFILKYNP